QAGARLWRLRRAWVARLSPPRHTLYRRLRLPDRRTRRPSPLRTALHPALLGICPSRRLPTPRRRRSAPNGMCRTRSQPSADVLSSPSPGPSRDALVAMRQSEKPAKFPITDAVRLRVRMYREDTESTERWQGNRLVSFHGVSDKGDGRAEV